MAAKEHEPHRGVPVWVGLAQVSVGGADEMPDDTFGDYDLLVPLAAPVRDRLRKIDPLLPVLENLIMDDFGPPPADLANILADRVIPLLLVGKRVLVFCQQGHGRTAAVLGMLIALLEPECTDPLAAVRERYCARAVPTRAAGELIFATAHQPLPEKWRQILK
jgi:protein-tyrosine phosphatase